jgi:hypothetical protein
MGDESGVIANLVFLSGDGLVVSHGLVGFREGSVNSSSPDA